MRLATVKLRHRATGRTIKLNQTDYARDVAGYRDWEILTLQRGEADVPTELEARRESDLNLSRSRDPDRLARMGDWRKDAYEQRAMTAHDVDTGDGDGTAPRIEREEATAAEAEGKDGEKGDEGGTSADAAWTQLPWLEMRAYVKRATGKVPRSKRHAAELMG